MLWIFVIALPILNTRNTPHINAFACVENVHYIFKTWKQMCPENDTYKMRLLYHKALSDCSESLDASYILSIVQETNCVS